ncbi:group I intron-associated PD-(D/E)XK endonuclease [Armatimonas rosea]|uniref:PD(D/E)XK endonuclease domain-containing protein n=1 Tax=Armatimonas rosea TaxID=685828 RepID=A0A7W9W5N9_ARMRO|nr:group I intron-associated PD-(D/E)XK endonuclease [Armatimonas rosea]MBB6049110.1 hypothetical protein [Armatimonas rosea]
MDTKAKGDRSVAMIMAAFIKKGMNVLIPFGDNCRYDLVTERDGIFSKIQCKSGRLKNGVVKFKTCSTYSHRNGGSRDYKGEVDFFGVYCFENEKIYLVPVNDVGIRMGVLRIDETKNCQTKFVRMANIYEM